MNRYEDRETQETILNSLEKIAIDSGYFKDMIAEQRTSKITYNSDEYLMLLNTYSPYLRLEPKSKEALFTELKHRIERT